MTDPDRTVSLLMEQRERWQRGEPMLVEAYLERLPELRDNPDVVLDLIYNEIFLRAQHGETPCLPEYLGRFPQFADALRLQFEVHNALDVDSSGSIEQESGSATPVQDVPTMRPQTGAAEPSSRTADVPGYQILGELGRGGMGVVYKARQKALKRLVALKMILSGVHASPKVRERFRIEAEAVARLQHPNIVQIYEVGEHDGQPFLTLELVAGGNLAHKVAGAPRPPRLAAELAETLARAMHHAHQHGIVHRDLKPANVLLTGEGVLKITDFGLAKLLDSSSGATPTEAFVGTPSYMAPEQARGEAKHIGPAADIYALGAILYELLTGRPPFQAATLLDTLEQVRTQEPMPPSRLQHQVPRDLETICLKCLEKEPARRYASAVDLADDLRRFLTDQPIRARPTSPVRRAVQWVRRRPALATLLVACVGGVLLAGGLLGWHAADRAAHWREQQKVERELAEEKTRQEDQARYRRFVAERDEALFHAVVGTQFTCMDLAAQVEAARAAADRALAAVSAGDGTLAPSPYWSDAEQREVQDSCYEMLLVLADALLRAAPPGPAPPEVAEAGRCLDRVARLGPPTGAYQVRRARYLDRRGDRAAAEQARGLAQAVQPTTAADFFLQGDEYYRTDDVPLARHTFDQALHRRPDHFWAQYYVALCDLRRGEPVAAEEGLTACLGRRPDFAWTYLVRGAVNTRLKEYDDAEGDFARVVEMRPDAAMQYALYVNRGILRLEEGKTDEAEKDLVSARELAPERPPAYLNLALLARRRKAYATALDRLGDVLQRNPDPETRAKVYANQADLFYLQDLPVDAIAACDRALQLRPKDTQVQGVKAQALLKIEKYPEAERAFTEYLQQGGRPDPDIYRGRGRARVQLGRYGDAIQDYTLGLALHPNANLYTHRGWAYVFVEAWQPGQSDFTEALRTEPQGVESLIGLSYCRVKQGDYRKAVEEAEEAWRRRPATPNMMHNVACVFAQAAGQAASDAALVAHYRSRAVQALREGLAEVPDGQRATFWRERMSRDDALDPIRASAAFQQLAAEYAQTKEPE
jgi:tetratricopeptide (TPR) repeat protein/predicted Ser/Thr protein kinase